MRKGTIQLLLGLLMLTGCEQQKAARSGITADIFFEPLSASATGIDFSNDLHFEDDLNIIEYLYYYNGGGVAIGDINNDGLEDLYLTANQKPDRLYLNLGNLKFKDITEASGLNTDPSWSTGVTLGDVNHDGLLDIYVCKVGNYKTLKAHNLLYINQGDGTFIEMAKSYGLDFSGFSTQGSFFDYDNDGDLDLYLMNHSVHTPRSYGTTALRKEDDPLAGDRLFENKYNEGESVFEDVTKAAGILSSPLGYGLALATADINGDGLIDIYVGNDFHENDYLYVNQGNKTFKERSADYLGHTSRFTMGVDIGDLNNDALPDILTLDMMPFDKEIFLKSAGEDTDKVAQIKANYGFNDQYARNAMQLNKGNGTFADIAPMTNTHATDWSWAPLIHDFDNDGLNDVFITNGIVKRPNDLNYINLLSDANMAQYAQDQRNSIEKKLIAEMPTMKLSNLIFKNQGGGFTRHATDAGFSPSYSNGAAYADLDNDGDLDLVVNNIDQQAQLFKNTAKERHQNNHVTFQLIDSVKNGSTLGSQVTLYANGKAHIRESGATRGFQSASTPRVHYGLGTLAQIDSIRVQWPDGTVQSHAQLDINQLHTIQKGQGTIVKRTRPIKAKAGKAAPFAYAHIENNYLDYDREALMPERLSAEGPALVMADFNADGHNDLFIGGAKYQSAAYFLGQKDGSFQKRATSELYKDAIYEDVDAAALDVDNDGDLDLYVLSGGNEITEESDYNEDRLYINDGRGKFVRLPMDMLKTNGGSVAAKDVNNDGYDDLFIGSRSIPGGYGLSPYSFILLNNGDGQFEIAHKSRMGMVTDSAWADINNDGLMDLVVVGDWMPVTVYLQEDNGTFRNATKELGLENTNGLWNCVTVSDVDGNGEPDLLVGNAGLNLKWKASVSRPVKLFLDDFDGNKQLDPIIFYDFFGAYVPFATKDQLVGQMPKLKKKFLDYGRFAEIETITDLVGLAADEVLETKKITELRSMAYFQEQGRFTGHALPMEAQMSSVQDIYHGNNQKAIIFVGNYLEFVNELGKSDANPGGTLGIGPQKNLSFLNYLGLPPKLNSRKLVQLGDNRYLIVANNGLSYVLENP